MERIEKLKRIALNLRINLNYKNRDILSILAKLYSSQNTETHLLDNEIETYSHYEEENKVIEQLNSLGISCTFILDEDYPENLKSLKSPPAILFYTGEWNRNLFTRSISIVGTRTPTPYGIQMTKELTSQLVSQGFVIVSGMAFGIDRVAHISAVESGGKTIAILASSPNNPTPANNSDVYKSIIDSGGLVISDTIPGQTINKNSFASRNSIVAGISDATLIIEAGEKSGTLITAEQAKKFNKHVFALPGNINSRFSAGTNSLIKESKARLITSVDDILNAMNIGNYNNAQQELNLENLTDNEMRTYNAMFDLMHSEEISLKINSDISDTLTVLSQLELKGLISRTDEGKYKKLANLIK